jgi:hypothetical protein
MRAVYYRRIAITIEMAIKVGIFCIIAVLIVALAAAGRPMTAFSRFW